jgi:hypothetical protein
MFFKKRSRQNSATGQTNHGPKRRSQASKRKPSWRPELLQLEDRVTPSGGPLANPFAEIASPFGTTSPTGLAPDQVRHAYGIDQIKFQGTITGDGSGQTIAIVDAYDDPNLASDLAAFDAYFGTTANQLNARSVSSFFSQVGQTGGARPTADPTSNHIWAREEALDVEWAHVVAPMANIILVEANDDLSLTPLLQGDTWAAASSGAKVISNSWGTNDFSGEAGYDSTFATSGVTFVFSAGDSGQVSYPAASPNVLSVGATNLTLNIDNSYNSETGWTYNTPQTGQGGGGGLSANNEARPTFQNGVSSVVGAWRGTPDVAYNGGPNSAVSVYDSFSNGTSTPWTAMYGTSAGAPQWAGLLAIANQGRARVGLSSLDGRTQTLPNLYSLPSTDFHDVTTGQNAYGQQAGPGYDLLTGLGTPVANRLVPDLAGLTLNYTTPQNGTHNVTVQIDGTAPNQVYDVYDNSTLVASQSVSLTSAISLTGGAGSASTFNIGTFNIPVYINLFGTSGSDTFSSATNSVALSGGASVTWSGSGVPNVTVLGQGGSDALTVQPGLTAPLTFVGGVGGMGVYDSISIMGTPYGESFTANVNSAHRGTDAAVSWIPQSGVTIYVVINSQGGNDTLTVQPGLSEPVTFVGASAGSSTYDNIVINGTTGNDNFYVNGNTFNRGGDAAGVTWNAQPGVPMYVTIYSQGTTQGGQDVLTVQPYLSQPITFIGASATDADTIVINGTTGNDTLYVFGNTFNRSGDAGSVTWNAQPGETMYVDIYGQGGTNTLSVQPHISQPIDFFGGSAGDTIVIYGTANNDLFSLNGNTFNRSGDAAGLTWHGLVGYLLLYGQGGTDTLNVQPGLNVGVTYYANAGSKVYFYGAAAGGDVFWAGPSSAYRQGDSGVTFTSTVYVYFDGLASGVQVHITPSQIANYTFNGVGSNNYLYVDTTGFPNAYEYHTGGSNGYWNGYWTGFGTSYKDIYFVDIAN